MQSDQWGRLEGVKRLFQLNRFHNSRYRHTVFSDTRVTERLKDIDSNDLRKINYHVAAQLIKEGLLQPIGYLDGTVLGHRYYSGFGLMTRWGDILLMDVDPAGKRGKELLSSQRLLERQQLFWDAEVKLKYLLLDALYLNNRVLGWRERNLAEHLVIKYRPKDGEIAQRFRRMISAFESMVQQWEDVRDNRKRTQLSVQMGFKEKRGEDKAKGVWYHIYYARSNSYDKNYSIARIEEFRKGESLGMFYVFTTDKELSPEQLRKLGHQRWYIENDGFKLLNSQVNTKKYHLDNEVVYRNKLLIQILAVGLLMLFRRENGYRLSRIYGSVKLTLRFVGEVLFEGNFYIGARWLDS